MLKIHQQAIHKKIAELKKHTFFDPTYDPVFKRIFKKKKNLIHFLNAILRLKGKREIVSVTHLRPTVHLRTPKKGKKITRFDIHARTRDGRFIDIEMQRAWHDDFLDRIELYSAMLSINAKIAMDEKMPQKQRKEHPYLMPTVYSIWICNFDVEFCRGYREEFGLFRHSDLGKRNPLPVYPKKRYIIIDLTKYVPQEGDSPEKQWIELFKNMPTAKEVPPGTDKAIRDVYGDMLVSKANKRFITEVATNMDEGERLMMMAAERRVAAIRRKGLAEGEARAHKKIKARDKKIVDFLRANGVAAKLLNAAMAIK